MFWCVLCVLWVIFSFALIQFAQGAQAAPFIAQHFLGLVGAPLAATAGVVVVTAFTQTDGPIKFKGFGFEFEGAAGPVILWVICFLAAVSGLKLLW